MLAQEGTIDGNLVQVADPIDHDVDRDLENLVLENIFLRQIGDRVSYTGDPGLVRTRQEILPDHVIRFLLENGPMGSGLSDHFPGLIGVQMDPGQIVSLGKQQTVTQWSQRFTQGIRIEGVGFKQDFSTITERDVCVLAKHVDVLGRFFQIWHEGRLLNRDIMSEYDLDKSFHEIVEAQRPGIDNAQRLQPLQSVSGVIERLLDLGPSTRAAIPAKSGVFRAIP